MSLSAELIDLIEQYPEEERAAAMAEYADALLRACADGRLSDDEVIDLCEMYDRLGISGEEWNQMRDSAWYLAAQATSDSAALKSISAFLYGKVEE